MLGDLCDILLEFLLKTPDSSVMQAWPRQWVKEWQKFWDTRKKPVIEIKSDFLTSNQSIVVYFFLQNILEL